MSALDSHTDGLWAAWSLRRLIAGWTGAVIRVANDAASEIDIGTLGSGELDESELLAHCGSGDGYVVAIYDQSGNARNLELRNSYRPRVVIAGVVQRMVTAACLDYPAGNGAALRHTGTTLPTNVVAITTFATTDSSGVLLNAGGAFPAVGAWLAGSLVDQDSTWTGTTYINGVSAGTTRNELRLAIAAHAGAPISGRAEAAVSGTAIAMLGYGGTSAFLYVGQQLDVVIYDAASMTSLASDVEAALMAVFDPAQEVVAPGLESALFGSVVVSRPGDTVSTPAGFEAQKWGQHSVSIPGVHYAVGFNALAFGEPEIRNQRNLLFVQEIDALAVGAAFIAPRIRWLFPLFEKAASVHGTAFIDYRVREVQPSGPYTLFVGQATVSRFGNPQPAGISSLRIGEPAIYDLAQRLRPSAGDTALFSDFGSVQNLIRVVRPESAWPPNGIWPWGEVQATVMLRFVDQSPERVDTLRFGSQTKIANRNRSIGASAGNTALANNANSIALKGVVYPMQGYRPGVWGQTLIAPRIRSITVTGFIPFRSQDRHHARHLDFQVLPQGLNGTVGTPGKVFDPEQRIRTRGWAAFAGAGVPWISRLDRTLRPRDIPSRIKIGTAFVAPAVRTLAPQWTALTAMGIAVARKFPPRTLSPKGPFSQLFGNAGIANVTPELRPRNTLMTQFGPDSRPYLEYRNFGITGFSIRLVPPPVVAFLDRMLKPAGHFVGRFGVQWIRNQIPDPPDNKTVFHVNSSSTSAPNGGNHLLGTVHIQHNVLVPQGFVATVISQQAQVALQGARPEGIKPLTNQVGYPSVNPAQFVYSAGDIHREDPTGTPHLWPHYIWAPRGYPYPPTAVMKEIGHIVDSEIGNPAFGPVAINHRNRRVTHELPHTTAFGDAQIELHRRYVYPQGFRSNRVWFPKLNAPQVVESQGDEVASFGQHEVTWRTPDPWPITPQAFDASGIGDTAAQLRDRVLQPAGLLPWGGLTFTRAWHEYDPFQMAGMYTHEAGSTWVSYRVREAPAEGFETSQLDWSVGQFTLRMRVRARTQRIAGGVGSSAFGENWIGNPHRSVLQSPTWPQLVPHPIAQARNNVVLAGAGMSTAIFGDVQDWEPGVVKIQAFDNVLMVAAPFIAMRVSVSPIQPADPPSARVGRRLSAAGLLGTVDVPAVTHQDGSHVCFSDSAGGLAVAATGIDSSRIGSGSIS